MGYNKGSPAYLVCILETGKIFKYRVVKFPRKEVEQQTQTEGPLGEDDFQLAKFYWGAGDWGRETYLNLRVSGLFFLNLIWCSWCSSLVM